jgi:hypothetical protein
VERLPASAARSKATLAEHFELFLTTVGVLVAIGVILAELPRGEEGVAIIFLVWLQGFMLWAVHRHCWFRRQALIHKMRIMLQDRVNNQLTVMLGMSEIRHRPLTEVEQEDMETVEAAARSVALELENLSIESLRSWERRYRGILPKMQR